MRPGIIHTGDVGRFGGCLGSCAEFIAFKRELHLGEPVAAHVTVDGVFRAFRNPEAHARPGGKLFRRQILPGVGGSCRRLPADETAVILFAHQEPVFELCRRRFLIHHMRPQLHLLGKNADGSPRSVQNHFIALAEAVCVRGHVAHAVFNRFRNLAFIRGQLVHPDFPGFFIHLRGNAHLSGKTADIDGSVRISFPGFPHFAVMVLAREGSVSLGPQIRGPSACSAGEAPFHSAQPVQDRRFRQGHRRKAQGQHHRYGQEQGYCSFHRFFSSVRFFRGIRPRLLIRSAAEGRHDPFRPIRRLMYRTFSAGENFPEKGFYSPAVETGIQQRRKKT